MKHLFIINPRAGKRDQTTRVLAMAESLRSHHGLDCSCLLTQSPGHATTLARKAAAAGPVRLYACGGDGTIYEVANGIAGCDSAAMTCIPVGTGNDFLKNFGPDLVQFSDPETLWNGDVFPLDLIDCNGRLCTTIACSGVDAQVAEDVHTFGSSSLLTGRGSYLAAVGVNFLFRGISHHWTVSLDGEELTGEFALAAVCNGRYYGGGSTPIPQARMNDGILNTILVRKVSRLSFARLFSDYSAGRHETLSPLVRVSTAQVIRIRGEEEIVTCLDGETFRSHDVTMRLSEKKLNFFGPPGCDCNRTAR